jgi:hypothetical protein
MITDDGARLAGLCDDLIVGKITVPEFCERVDEGQSGDFTDKVSEWEYDNLLYDLLYEIELYEPNPLLRENGLYHGDDDFIGAVKRVYQEYKEALATM